MSTPQLLDVFSSAAVFVEVSSKSQGSEHEHDRVCFFLPEQGPTGWGAVQGLATRSSGRYIAQGIAVHAWSSGRERDGGIQQRTCILLYESKAFRNSQLYKVEANGQ